MTAIWTSVPALIVIGAVLIPLLIYSALGVGEKLIAEAKNGRSDVRLLALQVKGLLCINRSTEAAPVIRELWASGYRDPAKVRAALAATKNFPLLEGNLSGFNSLHEILMPISVNMIKDGRFTSAGEITDLAAFAPPER